jgi:hypothetical protein
MRHPPTLGDLTTQARAEGACSRCLTHDGLGWLVWLWGVRDQASEGPPSRCLSGKDYGLSKEVMLKRCLSRTRLRIANLLTGGIIATPYVYYQIHSGCSTLQFTVSFSYRGSSKLHLTFVRPFATRICTRSFKDPVLEPRSYPRSSWTFWLAEELLKAPLPESDINPHLGPTQTFSAASDLSLTYLTSR